MKYHTVTENIKFPTYDNDALLKDLMMPVNPESVIEDFALYYKSITEFEEVYASVVEINLHDISKRFNDYERGVKYYLEAVKGLKRVINLLIDKIKAQFNNGIKVNSIQEKEVLINLMSSSMTTTNNSNNGNTNDNHLNNNIINGDSKEMNIDDKIVKELIEFEGKREQKIISSSKRIGIILINSAMKYGQHVLIKLNELISRFKLMKVYKGKDSELLLTDIILAFDNIVVSTIALYNAYFVDENDILNLDEDSDAWKRLKKNLVRVIVNDEALFAKELSQLNYQSETLFGAISKGFISTNNAINVFNALYCSAIMSINHNEGLLESNKFLIKIKDEIFINTTKIPQIPPLKIMTKAMIPSIAYRKKIYMKRCEKEITLQYINEILDHYKTNPNKPFPYVPNKINPNDIPYKEKTEKNEKPYYISTRLIHSSKLYLKQDKPSLFNSWFKGGLSNNNYANDTLMIYIHGGGYISGSTFASERFIRPWVNELKIPVIGINYSLSPEHKYPKAVDEVWQAYNWIIKNAKDQLNINPQHIIFSGDSAGGSICLAVLYLLIIHNVRLPELVIPFYPCCEQDPNEMSLSHLLVMQDKILNYKGMEFYNRAYVGRDSNTNDFINNQAKAPRAILEKLPKMRFFFGSLDPLRDGAIRVINRISEVNVDCLGYEFKNYRHAFLSFVGKYGNEVTLSILYKEIREHLASVNVNKK